MGNIILQDVLRGSGNTDAVESNADIRISGAGNGLRLGAQEKVGTGTAQSGATPLVIGFNVLSPTSGATAFVLPSVNAAGVGPVWCVNESSNTSALVFPPSGHLFQGRSLVNQSIAIGSYQACMFAGISQTTWGTFFGFTGRGAAS